MTSLISRAILGKVVGGHVRISAHPTPVVYTHTIVDVTVANLLLSEIKQGSFADSYV